MEYAAGKLNEMLQAIEVTVPENITREIAEGKEQ
jgi:hypothetical protein